MGQCVEVDIIVLIIWAAITGGLMVVAFKSLDFLK